MLPHVDICDPIRQHEFGKRLLGKWSENEYFFYLFYFNTISCFYPKLQKLPF